VLVTVRKRVKATNRGAIFKTGGLTKQGQSRRFVTKKAEVYARSLGIARGHDAGRSNETIHDLKS